MLLLIFPRGTNTHSTKPLYLISLGRSLNICYLKNGKRGKVWKIKGIFICIVDTLRLLTKALPGKSNKKLKSDF